jgi:transposase
VWLATGRTDMRKGFDGLALIVQETLKRDPHSGHLFVFRGRRGDLIKCLWHDGQGLCLFSKRLERGRFLWPSTADGTLTISTAQLGYLLEGIDWRMPQKTWRPTAADGPRFAVDKRHDEILREIWVAGFEKAVKLRPPAWQKLLTADHRRCPASSRSPMSTAATRASHLSSSSV